MASGHLCESMYSTVRPVVPDGQNQELTIRDIETSGILKREIVDKNGVWKN